MALPLIAEDHVVPSVEVLIDTPLSPFHSILEESKSNPAGIATASTTTTLLEAAVAVFLISKHFSSVL